MRARKVPSFQIWGRVQRLGTMEFGAIVTAMPDDDSAPQVEVKTFGTSHEADKAIEAMAVELSAKLRRKYFRIVEIVID